MMVLPAVLTAFAALSVVSTADAKPPTLTGTAAELKVLSPLASEVVPGKFAMNVDFTGKGVTPIVTAEMWVDGERWARQGLESPKLRGRLKFDVDATTLKAGVHTLMVRVIAEDGSVASITTQVALGASSGVPTVAPEIKGTSGGPQMAFRKPGNGNRVSGVVEIEVDAPQRGGVSPYVSFYVDQQWKTLKNFPPYSYTWDTTTVPNGYHTLEAMGYLETTNATSTRKMHVYVDNPGGNTIRMTEIPDLAPSPKAIVKSVKPVILPGPAQTALVPFGDLNVSSLGASRVSGGERREDPLRPATPAGVKSNAKAAKMQKSPAQLAMELFPAESVKPVAGKPAEVRTGKTLPPLFGIGGFVKPVCSFR